MSRSFSRIFFCLTLVVGCAQQPPADKNDATVSDSPGGTAASAPVKDQGPILEAPTADGSNWLANEEIQAGWIRLFDGHTLFGWKSNSALEWTASDGVITAKSSDAADKGLLMTTTRFADYELLCQYRLEKGGNSGIFLRSVFNPTAPDVDCYELNMCDSRTEFATASLVGRKNPASVVQGDGDWHTFHVRVEGPSVTVKFDGKQVLEYTDETENPLKTGHIGLQMNGGKIEFRNVYLKPLGTRPLFDGKTLAGWHEVPGSKSQFTVSNGAIRVLNGRGFLETDLTAGNFVLQFQAVTNGKELNSGVFFRAMRGTEEAPSHGYEFQIHNGFKNGDRTQPVDHGTGGIFKRVSARRVVSDDYEWLTSTLIADGNHIATWVNGTQLVDWTDERPANENPREGSRTAAGHLSLQGHDPTTDLSFRNLLLGETPP
ncbi:DUF1080 domain-containing protein [Schlesneria sp. T3-172]|uniref:3-keto-disaccharide hydrolase n=1 Tax=Schlesneria sphaerica TaxID=3373610 RepID=UPI0037C561BC